jgi:chromosome partitioning protein
VERRVIAILNLKGGSAKTTTAVSLAEALANAGRRVLLVDLDPQASASTWLGVKDDGQGFLEALQGSRALAELVRPTSAPGVDLISSGTVLTKAEGALSSEIGAEQTLRALLADLPGRWDFILLDCPPGLNVLARNALMAAGELLIPVEARTMAVEGLVSLVNIVRRVRQLGNSGLRYAGILVCRLDLRTRMGRETLAALQARFNDASSADLPRVLGTTIRDSIRLGEAPGHRLPIAAYAPGSSGAIEYGQLAAELLAQEEG